MAVLEVEARPHWTELARRHAATIVPAVVTWSAILVALGLFGRIMTFPLGHDEQIHVTAATLLFEQPLYRVLGYNHLPGLPVLGPSADRRGPERRGRLPPGVGPGLPRRPR